MNQTIHDAVRNRCVLSFSYHGHPRIMEPHTHGITTAGNEAVRCYQTAGTSDSGTIPGWRMILVSEIISLSVSGEHFVGERPGYSKGDKGMSTIFVEL